MRLSDHCLTRPTFRFLTIVLLAAFVAGCTASERPADQIPSKHVVKFGLWAVKNFRQWEADAEPFKIAGPIYFVGTKGLGVFLFATGDGLILLNTGMPGSGPMIERSIRRVGFEPQNIKYMIVNHAHIDHAGALAYLKGNYPDAAVAVMKEEVPLLRVGGLNDPVFGNALAFRGVKADRVLHHGDTIELGGLVLKAYHTPGHSRGATTWITEVAVDGVTRAVAVPDGGNILPFYRLKGTPSYEGIAEDFRQTLEFLADLKPDIWLAPHNISYDFAEKRRRAKTEGATAWIDPEGYKDFVDDLKCKFYCKISR